MTIRGKCKWFVVFVLILSAISFAIEGCSNCKPKQINTIKIDSNRSILIYADTCWEVNRGLYYEVFVGENEVVTLSHWGTDDGGTTHQFNTIVAENTNLVGVIETTQKPYKLIIMHDFSNNESWPMLKGNEVSHDKSVIEKRKNLFFRLAKNNKDIPYPSFLKGE